MPTYITIADARKAGKGSIIAKVVGVSEAKSGVGDKGKWENQIATLKDHSGTMPILLWNDDIGKLDQGQHYKFEAPFWTTYKNEPQLSLGKFCTIHPATKDDLLGSETPEESATLQEKHDVNKEPTSKLEKFVLEENSLLTAISSIVRAELTKEQDTDNPVRGDVVWVRTKEIYNQWRINHD